MKILFFKKNLSCVKQFLYADQYIYSIDRRQVVKGNSGNVENY